jgi:hypothetical protein
MTGLIPMAIPESLSADQGHWVPHPRRFSRNFRVRKADTPMTRGPPFARQEAQPSLKHWLWIGPWTAIAG